MNKTVPEWVLDGLPAVNARRVISAGQKVAGLIGVVLLAAALAADVRLTLLVLNLAVIVLYLVFSLYKLALPFISLAPVQAPLPPDGYAPAEWPVYTLLVPLYHESEAVPGLVAHLAELDYPADKLNVLLLVEEDDAATRTAVNTLVLPAFCKAIVVPVSWPRTKPKACNYGLREATGEYLVIYDAEDRPERDQLRKAVYAFDVLPECVVCLQAGLNFYNRDTNLLTRLFTAEYSTWFDFCLPALFRLDAPIPLGGTSNHFKLDRLRALGGWDPFNVTEDCDLGIRLYAEGGRVACLESTTWEEATFRLLPWIRQRSRWIKGYIQTYLVHLRQHRRLVRRLGVERVLHLHLLFGATGFCLLLNPFYWGMAGLWVVTRSDFITSLYPLWVLIPGLFCLLVGNAAFVLSAMLACLHRRNYALLPYCLLMPFYWVLMSIGAWKGALQLLWRPFYWEKTPHMAHFKLGEPR